MLGGDHRHPGRARHLLQPRRRAGARPRPGVPKPQRRQQVQTRLLRAPVVHRHLHQHVLRRRFGVLDENVEIAVVVEDAGIEKLVFELATAARPVGGRQVGVWVGRLWVLVEELHVRVGGRAVQVEVVLLDILAVVALGVGKPEHPLLQDRVTTVPQRQREAQPPLVVAKPGNAVLTPAIRPRPCLLMGEVRPGVAVVAVVLADSSPLPLAKVGTPPPPGHPPLVRLHQALLLGVGLTAHLDLVPFSAWRSTAAQPGGYPAPGNTPSAYASSRTTCTGSAVLRPGYPWLADKRGRRSLRRQDRFAPHRIHARRFPRRRQPATGPPGGYPDRTPTGRRRRASDRLDRWTTTSRSLGARKTRAKRGLNARTPANRRDHLAELVDRPVQVAPLAGDLHIRLVDEPPIPGIVPGGPGRLDEQRGEPRHPAEERGVVHFDAAFGGQLLDVAVGQPVAQVPAHGQRDDLGREPEPGEPRTLGRDLTCQFHHSRVLNRPADRPRFQRNSADRAGGR